LGLEAQLAHTLSKPIAWLAIGAAGFLLLRSSLVPAGIKLVVTVVGFMAAIGWADHAGVLRALTGHNVDDADKLLVAIVGTFALWLAFLREERLEGSPRAEGDGAFVRMMAGRRR
jgi:hypothetical protein